MVGRLVQLIVLGIVAYYGYTVGLPWAKERFNLRSEPTEEDRAAEEAFFCVSQGDRANDQLVSEVRQIIRPPVDQAVWSTVLIQVGGSISAAETACSCSGEACARVGEAMYELRQLLTLFDDMVGGRSQSFGNPAVRQERVDRLLNEARSLAGG